MYENVKMYENVFEAFHYHVRFLVDYIHPRRHHAAA